MCKSVPLTLAALCFSFFVLSKLKNHLKYKHGLSKR